MEKEVWERLMDNLQTHYVSMVDSSEEIQFNLDAMPRLVFDENLAMPWRGDNTFEMTTNEGENAAATVVRPPTEHEEDADEVAVCISLGDDASLDFLDEIDVYSSFGSDTCSLDDEPDLLHEFDLHRS